RRSAQVGRALGQGDQGHRGPHQERPGGHPGRRGGHGTGDPGGRGRLSHDRSGRGQPEGHCRRLQALGRARPRHLRGDAGAGAGRRDSDPGHAVNPDRGLPDGGESPRGAPDGGRARPPRRGAHGQSRPIQAGGLGFSWPGICSKRARMLEDQESEFILSIFLMEAWDSVASVEEGVRRLAGGDPPSSAILDPLVVVAHRLKGASALHGYPVVSAVALVMESLLEKLPGLPADEQGRTIEALEEVVATVRQVLDMIGDEGREDVETVSRLRARHPELFPVHPEPELAPHSPGRTELPPVSRATGTEPRPLPREGGWAVDVPAPAAPPRSVFSRPLPPPASRTIPEGPHAPLDQIAADVLIADLERFFAEHAESVPYFAPEAAEHLEVMTRSILALEEATGAAKDVEVATLFRAVHTLKGAAYTVGCAPVGHVAHRIEDILDAVRDHRLDFAPAVFDAVLGGVDTLRLLLGGSARAAVE